MGFKFTLTSEELPPRNHWVLALVKNYQKPFEILDFNGTEEDHTWTSGHGDIITKDPIAWAMLPNNIDFDKLEASLKEEQN